MGIPLLSFGTWQNCRSAGLSSSAVLHVVNASPSSSLLSSSVVLPREVKMLAIATAALLVLAANAEAAFVKYDYGGRESYKHEDSDSYKPSYEHKRGDDYVKLADERSATIAALERRLTDLEAVLSQEEAGVTESQAMEETMDLVDSLRDGQARKCKCTSKGPNGHHKPCHRKGSNTHNKYFCYVKHKCRGSKPSKHHHGFHWATHTCCGKNKKCRGH